MKTAPYVLLDDQITPSVRRYSAPIKVITAASIEDLEDAFAALKAAHADGFYLAGYMGYELGYALEPKLAGLMPEQRDTPLLQFGVFEHYDTQTEILKPDETDFSGLTLKPDWDFDQYKSRFDRVMAYIEAGDVYQINLTFPMRGVYHGETEALYRALRHRQPGRYGGVISLGGPDILSLSPELFFQTTGADIRMRPMKGTARRQADPVQDAALRDAMRHDLKSQAENLMIVDLLRNDVSRIAEKASVTVPELFTLETYPTLHQMTSQIRARLRPDTDFRQIIQSLFPCGSITGAPKIRAMEIIHELEPAPRGAYCGAMGYIDPNGDMCFNVAIRTLTLGQGEAVYNVGGGLVLDSRAEDEYAECLLKSKVLAATGPDLIETLRWTPSGGALRGDLHKARMERSAKALGYPFSRKAYEACIASVDSGVPQKLRLVLSPEGTLRLDLTEFEPVTKLWTVAISKNSLTQAVQETRYKVSHREFYDGERRRVASLTGCDDVIFLNDREEICEGSFTSLFIEKNGQLYTPSVSSGILPGVLREALINEGRAMEAVMTLDDVLHADKLYVGNSLRGLIHVSLADQAFH